MEICLGYKGCHITTTYNDGAVTDIVQSSADISTLSTYNTATHFTPSLRPELRRFTDQGMKEFSSIFR